MEHRYFIWTFVTFFSWFSVLAAAEDVTANPEVVWALDYQLPTHSCNKPKLRNSNQPDQIDKFQRKFKRYANCVATHQMAIIGDHQRIVAAVGHGVTEEQAQIMARKLNIIEEAVVQLGEDSTVTLDQLEVERLLSGGTRPSI